MRSRQRTPECVLKWLSTYCNEKSLLTPSAFIFFTSCEFWYGTSDFFHLKKKPLGIVNMNMVSLQSGLFCECLGIHNGGKNISEEKQAKGLSPVSVIWWVLRFPDREKVLSHWGHLQGFSPVWTIMGNSLRKCSMHHAGI